MEPLQMTCNLVYTEAGGNAMPTVSNPREDISELQPIQLFAKTPTPITAFRAPTVATRMATGPLLGSGDRWEGHETRNALSHQLHHNVQPHSCEGC